MNLLRRLWNRRPWRKWPPMCEANIYEGPNIIRDSAEGDIFSKDAIILIRDGESGRTSRTFF